MIHVHEMKAAGGAVCLHCGTHRIAPGEKCLMVASGKGVGYIALAHADQHPLTKTFKIPEDLSPTI